MNLQSGKSLQCSITITLLWRIRITPAHMNISGKRLRSGYPEISLKYSLVAHVLPHTQDFMDHFPKYSTVHEHMPVLKI